MLKLSGSTPNSINDGLAAWAVNAGTGHFWVLLAIGVVIALACGIGIFYFMRRARLIEDTPTSRIRSAPQGYVEIIGEVKYFANESVIAPLTKLPCAWYHFTIEKQETVRTGKGSHTSWRVVEQQTSDRVFVCEDDSGQCVIDPRGAEVHTHDDVTWYGSTRWPQTPGPANQSIFSSRDYRYRERRLNQSEPLYALGKFNTVDPNKAHGDVSDEVRAILKVWKQDQAALLERFDANQDGQIDLGEWEQVRAAANQQAYQQRLARADRAAIHILSRTDDFRRPYILSVSNPDKLTRKFKLKAFGCLAGFVIFMPVSLWLIIVRLSA